MREIIENWQGTDADLLNILNEKTIKRLTPNPTSQPGFFGFRGMSLVNTPLAVELGFTLKSLADYMSQAVNQDGSPDMSTRAMGATVLGFWHIFYHDTAGLPLADDAFRYQLSQLLQSSGKTPEFIADVLAFGYTSISPAYKSLGRDATQQDIDVVRTAIARDQMQAEWSQLFSSEIQPALETGTRADVVAAIRAVAVDLEG